MPALTPSSVSQDDDIFRTDGTQSAVSVHWIEKDRYIRLHSGILYTLNKLSESGHCYAVRSRCTARASGPFLL